MGRLPLAGERAVVERGARQRGVPVVDDRFGAAMRHMRGCMRAVRGGQRARRRAGAPLRQHDAADRGAGDAAELHTERAGTALRALHGRIDGGACAFAVRRQTREFLDGDGARTLAARLAAHAVAHHIHAAFGKERVLVRGTPHADIGERAHRNRLVHRCSLPDSRVRQRRHRGSAASMLPRRASMRFQYASAARSSAGTPENAT